jgi:DNA-binding CsgD family transcriptional regulator
MQPNDTKSLGPKQTAILRYLGLGLSTKQIASELAIDEKTVEFHINSASPQCIAKVINIQTRADMVRYAIESGLVKKGEKFVSPVVVKNMGPIPELKNLGDLTNALLHAASRAAAGQAEPLQVQALCQTTHSIIELGRFLMEAGERGADIRRFLTNGE